MMKELIDKWAAISATKHLQTYKLAEDDDMVLVDLVDVQTELMIAPATAAQKIWDDGTLYISVSKGQLDKIGRVLATEDETTFCKQFYEDAEPERQWIPFNIRSLTEEEKEDHPEWDCILDCELPDDGQAILVSINVRGHERVQYDEFFTDDGSYLDSGYEIGTEATAWMPLPKPYQEGESK